MDQEQKMYKLQGDINFNIQLQLPDILVYILSIFFSFFNL